MADIVLSIGLDDSDIKKTVRDTEKEIKSSFKDEIKVKADPSEVKDLNISINNLNSSFQESTSFVGQFSSALSAVGLGVIGISNLSTNFLGLNKRLLEINKTLFLNTRTVFDLVASLTLLGPTLVFLGTRVLSLDNVFTDLIGTIAIVSGVLVTGLGAGILFLFNKMSELTILVGNKLVGVFKDISGIFIQTSSQAQILAATVQAFNRITSGGVGDVSDYTNQINELSTSLNLTVSSLQKAAQEIVSVGARVGLSQEQIQNLIRVSAEYAKITGKDVFDSSVAFSGALLGNTQAVLSYGVKLTDSANALFLLKQGIDDNFDSLTDSEKIQVRYNNLLSQNAQISSIAAVTANTLADQTNKLAVTNERLSSAFGRGAALVEANNIGTAGYVKIISLLNTDLVSAAGFVGALGARLIQFTGIVIKASFAIFSVVKAISILNLVLAADLTQSVFAKSIPLVGKSFNQLIKQIVGSSFKIKSAQDLINVATLAFFNLGSTLGILVDKNGRKVVSFGSSLALIFSKVKTVIAFLIPIISTLLTAFAPLILTVGVAVASFLLFREVLKEIEKRTGVFTEIFRILREEIGGVSTIFAPLVNFLKGAFNEVALVIQRAFGVIVFSIAKVLEGLLFIAAKNPLGIFSQKSVAALGTLKSSLSDLSTQLASNSFLLSDFGQRSIASSGGAVKNFDALLEKLKEIRFELQNVGKTDLQILEESFNERNRIIKEGLTAGALLENEFQELSLKSQLDFEEKRKEIQERQKQGFNSVQQSILNFTKNATRAFAVVGAALVKNENAFEAFLGAILGIFGDLLIEVGAAVVAIGFGIESVKESLSKLTGAAAIATGLALIGLGGALKALSGIGSGQSKNSSFANATTPVFPGTGPETEAPLLQEQQSRVTVNIQGDVLDSQGTALRIVELIREATDNQGVRFA